MSNILKITTLNYEDVLSECISMDKNELSLILQDCFLYVPHKVEIICQLIIDICKNDLSFVDNIKEISKTSCSSIHSNISLLFYCKCLDFNVPCVKLKTIQNDFFTNNDIKISNELEINEYLNNLEMFIEQIKFPNKEIQIDELELFKIICIIENYQFDIYECLDELQKFCSIEQAYLGILYLLNKEDIHSFYLINLILRSLHNKESLDILFIILKYMNKQKRDLLITFIYEWFINKRIYKHPVDSQSLFETSEEIDKLKKYIDEETVKEMKKFVSVQNLEKFIPEYKQIYEMKNIKCLKKEDFKIEKNRNLFFRDFCLLGSPSISHFLSYLEIYKEEMKMNEEEQKDFLSIFNELFDDKTSFKRIVLDKMRRFKFITLK